MTRYSTETFRRGAELGRDSCRVGAPTYNLMRVLLARAGDCVFVPIRPMQYLAVVDAEEVIFIDGHERRWVEVAWRNFRPALRAGLDEPVYYEAVYYREGGRESARRLHAEFPRALALLGERGRPVQPGRVLSLDGSAASREGDKKDK